MRARAGQDLPGPGAAAANHERPSALVTVLRACGEVRIDLGLERQAQHALGSAPADLIQCCPSSSLESGRYRAWFMLGTDPGAPIPLFPR